MQKAPLGQQKLYVGQLNWCVPAGQGLVTGVVADAGARALAATRAVRANPRDTSFLRIRVLHRA